MRNKNIFLSAIKYHTNINICVINKFSHFLMKDFCDYVLLHKFLCDIIRWVDTCPSAVIDFEQVFDNNHKGSSPKFISNTEKI